MAFSSGSDIDAYEAGLTFFQAVAQMPVRLRTFTHVFHVLRLIGGSVPAVVEDEDVGFGQPFIHLVEEMLLLHQTNKTERAEAQALLML